MSGIFILIFLTAAAARITSVIVSKLHERQLRAEGAEEHGAFTSKVIAMIHTLFYLSAFAEGWQRNIVFDGISALGLFMLAFAFAMLVWIVRLLGPVWTVKIMIARNHPLSRHPLFLYVRHPNYFLNILPELIGYALIFQAWWTLSIGLPIYIAALAVRIAQEEKAMKQLFAAAARR